jgi:hypothetical protein
MGRAPLPPPSNSLPPPREEERNGWEGGSLGLAYPTPAAGWRGGGGGGGAVVFSSPCHFLSGL